MTQVTCTQKMRNKYNQIIGYTIIDSLGNTMDVKAEALKQAIKTNKIVVDNLVLTSDNKLINKTKLNEQTQKRTDIESLVNKAMTLGPKAYISGCGHSYYILENKDTVVIIIPNNVKRIIGKHNEVPIYSNIRCESLKVVGGAGLNDGYRLFHKCEAKEIDLSKFDTSNIDDMSQMFYKCRAEKINFEGFNTSKVETMVAMFADCSTRVLDLTTFNTSKVTNMNGMFWLCQSSSIQLTSFNTENVNNMAAMFKGCCNVDKLDLSTFKTNNDTMLNGILEACDAEIITNDERIKAIVLNRDFLR